MAAIGSPSPTRPPDPDTTPHPLRCDPASPPPAKRPSPISPVPRPAIQEQITEFYLSELHYGHRDSFLGRNVNHRPQFKNGWNYTPCSPYMSSSHGGGQPYIIIIIIIIIDIIERKRLQWCGHVKRMQDEKLPKLIMEWIPGERRKRGRPRKTWMEGVQAATKTRHLEADQWLNRKEWCLGSGKQRQLSQDRKDR